MKIKRSILNLFLVLPFLWMASSCDKIDPPFIEPGGAGNPNTGTEVVRKILLEDFTGHTCGNCPRAAETTETLKQLYGDQLIVIGVHMGWFAIPKTSPDTAYTYDFRTVPGSEIDAQYNIDMTGLPKGMVNRVEVSGSPLMAYAGWGTAAQGFISLEPDVDISIVNTYNTTTRTVTSEITSDFLNGISGTYNVAVVLTEDTIYLAEIEPSLYAPGKILPQAASACEGKNQERNYLVHLSGQWFTNSRKIRENDVTGRFAMLFDLELFRLDDLFRSCFINIGHN